MEKKKPLISILTPAWNRSGYLEKAWCGLDSQSYAEFEWIIANDGSIDNTLKVCLELKKKSKFSVTIIDSNIRLGKPRMDNELLKAAKGEFIIWCDSDDYLLPTALERLIEIWESIPQTEQLNYLGLTAMCSTKEGVLQSTPFPITGSFDTTLSKKSDFDRDNGGGDNLLFIKTEYIKNFKFIEGDFMVTESSFWLNFHDMKIKYIPEVMKIMDRGASNRISFSGKMEYCRGKAYGLVASEKIKPTSPGFNYNFIWILITYHRYCIHGDIRICEARNNWKADVGLFYWLMLYLPGLLLAFKDIIQGKVIKTHIEYDKNLKSSSINIIN